jgi:carbamoyl-phosphate synthase small subunit
MADVRPLHAPRPEGATGVVVFADGRTVWGQGFGAEGEAVGELCFNTAMTGYQEVMTDPSYAKQVIAFTFPHIGNVGANDEDIEAAEAHALGCLVREVVTEPSNYRANQGFADWMRKWGRIGIAGVDTRALTKLVRTEGPPTIAIAHRADGQFDLEALRRMAAEWPGLEGMDLAKEVTCLQSYEWRETAWRRDGGYGTQDEPRFHVVAVDYGAKRNILRMLAEHGCRVTVVPATASTEEILRHQPDGIFLSNGPGDPAATGEYAVPVLRDVIQSGKPVFGICLGHQMLALALGGRTYKLDKGHRGANHPVRDDVTGKVEITSQNHGFVVDPDCLPDGISGTHTSLFDRTNEGLCLSDRPVFSVQHHPEASPGPQDSHYLFQRFIDLMAETSRK